MSVPGADGYIVYYNGGESVLIEGQDSTNYTLKKLVRGNKYLINVTSFSNLPSMTNDLLFFFTGSSLF